MTWGVDSSSTVTAVGWEVMTLSLKESQGWGLGKISSQSGDASARAAQEHGGVSVMDVFKNHGDVSSSDMACKVTDMGCWLDWMISLLFPNYDSMVVLLLVFTSHDTIHHS